MRAGHVFLDTLEPLGDDRYRLHSKTKVTPTHVGANKYLIPEEEWIPVKFGYVIALHYPNANSIPIIPYADSSRNLSLTPYIARDLSDVVDLMRHDDSLAENSIIASMISDRRRLPAVNVHFSSK